ncbi:hypothetical protein KOM00_01450 [Geomonas sp. Red69]|uniref:Uncharacterized protein n=1 Tax=Geomonas diazotrophica TaxID=2843197 RepID=A0ABX8JGQ2_9BACT|nr:MULTISPECIES: hypothetical protein [Geomonas]MBU5635394.1 hypothetical protein [Geomonas diazotrophica]QWV97550.1 hypothetical protein KP005_19815 [Geomonas nitrogeniifigens]QXE86691.1 hypothetical protein KP003_20470 [Geomonas nitrogeniifigens]
MKGYQLVKEIREAKSAHPDGVFIKWWRNEEDFIDFDLLDRFLQNLNESEKIDGFELINEDEMWRTLEARCQGRVFKEKRDGDWVLRWTPPPNRKVEESETEYPYTAESMVKILDSETNYNYVD